MHWFCATKRLPSKRHALRDGNRWFWRQRAYTEIGVDLGGKIDDAVLDDRCRALGGFQFLERIARHEKEVGKLARDDRAQVFLPANDPENLPARIYPIG
jgi:hypothetical protein